jgi:sporulation protein YlmC with PRC-barrel domain
MELRADQLLGRRVVAKNGRTIGRLEEYRAAIDGTGCAVQEYVIGPAGLLERLGIAARILLGLAQRGYLVHWHQLALSEHGPLRLTCAVAELRPRQ